MGKNFNLLGEHLPLELKGMNRDSSVKLMVRWFRDLVVQGFAVQNSHTGRYYREEVKRNPEGFRNPKERSFDSGWE